LYGIYSAIVAPVWERFLNRIWDRIWERVFISSPPPPPCHHILHPTRPGRAGRELRRPSWKKPGPSTRNPRLPLPPGSEIAEVLLEETRAQLTGIQGCHHGLEARGAEALLEETMA